jgi:hypothetical protein
MASIRDDLLLDQQKRCRSCFIELDELDTPPLLIKYWDSYGRDTKLSGSSLKQTEDGKRKIHYNITLMI